jgi:PKD repeat protein
VTQGTTYYFQTADVNGDAGALTFTLFVTPPPTAFFFLGPPDRSIFDPMSFTNFSSDPGGVAFQPASWDFGDGTTTTTDEIPVLHQYAKDGDYTVELTVTTLDSRTDSTSQVVHVRTHDVAITKFLTPTAASTGQTRSITIGVSNARYPETVEVELFKSRPDGFGNPVGSVTQPVPVSKGKTTAFNINYTFTSDDAALGKVSFEAVATIVGARDAFTADNTAISTPTKINH